ncbi:TetR/AcrR family transcriptional regulator [Enterococcus sp. AZ103]|uniref:TetR/AcrR family transcriptional regulator n=1 Tax=Enterococcus sp. AZ103 TaxID=2774628 RepID=UPI003F28D77B
MERKIDRTDIVREGMQLLNQAELDGVTLKALAERLGIKSPSLYNHFKNREELLGILAEASLANFYQALFSAKNTEEPIKNIRLMADAYLTFALDYPSQYILVQNPNYWRSKEAVEISNQIVSLVQDELQNFSLSPEKEIHFVRLLRAYLDGFSIFSNREAFKLPVSIEKSFIFGLDLIITGLVEEREK